MLARLNDGFYAMDRLRGEVDRLFENLAEGWPALSAYTWGASGFPALNIWEDEGNLYAEAEIPGLKMEDVEVSVCGNELTIKGERKDSHAEGAAYHRRERGTGAFARVVRLPVEVEADKVEAALSAGVLTVTLPKAEAARPRKIQVKSAS